MRAPSSRRAARATGRPGRHHRLRRRPRCRRRHRPAGAGAFVWHEHDLDQQAVAAYGLAFYVANAEAEYKYSGPDGSSADRHGRSRRFVGAFRSLAPQLPGALSSFCHADRHDLDWAVWREAGFHYFPQAYVNEFGADANPRACLRSAAAFFPTERVQLTIGTYGSRFKVSPARYATLLERAGTDGFSVYLAEVRMPAEAWSTLGTAADG